MPLTNDIELNGVAFNVVPGRLQEGAAQSAERGAAAGAKDREGDLRTVRAGGAASGRRGRGAGLALAHRRPGL